MLIRSCNVVMDEVVVILILSIPGWLMLTVVRFKGHWSPCERVLVKLRILFVVLSR